MTRRKWRIKRMMAVPANWQGTPDHFYHFLLGYFMPLVLWQERTGITKCAVRDCGPMNAWFELLRSGTDLDTMSPGIMLERVLSHRQERVILHDWDNPTRFHRSSLDTFHHTIVSRVSATRGRLGQPHITVLDRRPGGEYYRSDAADSEGSGADRRSLPNVAQIAEALGECGSVTVADTAAMTPAEQVRLIADTDVLIGQHGAGLANMVWLPRGAAVMELRPPLPQTITDIFANLAAARGLGYRAVEQADLHTAVDPASVEAAATSLLRDPAAHVPRATGSLPMRLVRQLPRRL